jgi:hypothetical protein
MGDVATLLSAIAAVITAIGGASAAIIVALRSGGRQRVAAAEEATRLAGHGARREPDPHTPRHQRDAPTGDALVERLEHALAVARAADEFLDSIDGDDSDDTETGQDGERDGD